MRSWTLVTGSVRTSSVGLDYRDRDGEARVQNELGQLVSARVRLPRTPKRMMRVRVKAEDHIVIKVGQSGEQ